MTTSAHQKEKEYWSQRYANHGMGWDLGEPSTPLKEYIDQLDDKHLKILIPGAGNAYEAGYLFNMGFMNVVVVDIALAPLQALKKRAPAFPADQLIEGDFFEHQGHYDLILEQTFFCSFPPSKHARHRYAKKMHELLKPDGKLVGLWFDFPLTGDMEKRPFGGDKAEYLGYFSPLFTTRTFERAYNSIGPRQGNELFAILEKRYTM